MEPFPVHHGYIILNTLYSNLNTMYSKRKFGEYKKITVIPSPIYLIHKIMLISPGLKKR